MRQLNKEKEEHAASNLNYEQMLEDLRNSMNGSIFKRAAGRIRNLPVSLSFNAWLEVTARLAEERQKLHHGLMRLLARDLARGFSAWEAFLQVMRDQQQKMRSAMHRMLQRQLSRAFETWQYWLEELLHNAGIGERVLARMMHRKMFTAWATWHDWHRFGRLEILKARYSHMKEKRQNDLEVCALEMSCVVTESQDEIERMKDEFKLERKAIWDLLLVSRNNTATVQQELAAMKNKLEEERLLMEKVKEQKDKEIEKLRNTQLRIFMPTDTSSTGPASFRKVDMAVHR